jgi:hypothetical protein
MVKSLPYSYFHRLPTDISTIRLSTSTNCAALRIVKRHLQCRQHTSNSQNISNVPLIFIESKYISLLIAESKGKYLCVIQYKWILCHPFLDLLWKRQKETYKCRLCGQRCPETKPINCRGFFDNLRELVMRLDIMKKPARIYSVDEKGFG